MMLRYSLGCRGTCWRIPQLLAQALRTFWVVIAAWRVCCHGQDFNGSAKASIAEEQETICCIAKIRRGVCGMYTEPSTCPVQAYVHGVLRYRALFNASPSRVQGHRLCRWLACSEEGVHHV